MDENSKLESNQDGGGSPRTPDSEQLQKLNDAISQALTTFELAGKELLNQIIAWVFICCGVIAFVLYLYFCKFFHICFGELWTWQLIYFTAIRLTFVSAVFYVGIYCFKMLSATFQMYQHNKHKQAILNSLPSLVVASLYQKDAVNQDTLYNKILDIILTFSNTGIISNEHEVKPTSDILQKILDALLKLLKK